MWSRGEQGTHWLIWSPPGWTGTWVSHSLQLWWCGWPAEEPDALCYRAKHTPGPGDREPEGHLREDVSSISWVLAGVSMSLSWNSTWYSWTNLRVKAIWLLLQITFQNSGKKALWPMLEGMVGNVVPTELNCHDILSITQNNIGILALYIFFINLLIRIWPRAMNLLMMSWQK